MTFKTYLEKLNKYDGYMIGPSLLFDHKNRKKYFYIWREDYKLGYQEMIFEIEEFDGIEDQLFADMIGDGINAKNN